MSFLYKALLKNGDEPVLNQAQGASNAQGQSPTLNGPQHNAMPMFADSAAAKTPGYLWLLVGLLLLVVGLLAGYIFGQQQNGQSTGFYANRSSNATYDNNNNTEAKKSKDEVATDVISDSLVSTDPTNLQKNLVPLKETHQRDMLTAQGETTNSKHELAASDLETTYVTTDSFKPAPAQSQPLLEQTSPQSVEQQNVTELNATASLTTGEPLAELEVSDIPEDLKSKFALAVEATEELPDTEFLAAQVSSESSLTSINDLSAAEKAGIPPLYFGMHIFASDPKERWVKINNRVLREGDDYMPGMRLLEIRQDIVVWETRYTRFAQEALEDFAG